MKKVLLSLILILASYSVQAQTWTAQTSPVATDLNSIWAVDANIVWACGPTGVVIKTTNGGTLWSLANTGLTGNDFYTVTATDANNCIVGASDGGIWRTTNGGTSWTFILLTPAPVFIDVVHMFDANNGFAISDPTASAGLWLYYITTNGGANWTAGANRPPNAAGEAGWNNSYMALDTGHIWWGTNVSKIWKGGFKGPFTSATTTQPSIFGVAFNDASTGVAALVTSGNLAAPTATSVNGGTSWTNTAFTPAGVPFAVKGVPFSGYVWIGHTTGIMMSTNSGTTFAAQFPLTNACYGLTFVSVNLGWACTALGKIYKFTNTLSGIEPGTNGTPSTYALGQNYPNPFNPTTNISYTLPKASDVTVKIYDVLGNEVMSVVNEHQNAGFYTRSVDGSNLSSGVYFYTIKAGEFSQTKRMSLVK